MGYFTLKDICEVQNDDNMLCPTPSIEWPEAYERNSSFHGSDRTRQERDADNLKVSHRYVLPEVYLCAAQQFLTAYHSCYKELDFAPTFSLHTQGCNVFAAPCYIKRIFVE